MSGGRHFDDKQSAREWVRQELQRQKAARFPFPVEGCIPDFAGPGMRPSDFSPSCPPTAAGVSKVNPDSPQKPLRERTLARGITFYKPTPRPKAGFMKFDPERIPAGGRSEPVRSPPVRSGPSGSSRTLRACASSASGAFPPSPSARDSSGGSTESRISSGPSGRRPSASRAAEGAGLARTSEPAGLSTRACYRAWAHGQGIGNPKGD